MRVIWLGGFLFILIFVHYPVHCNDEEIKQFLHFRERTFSNSILETTKIVPNSERTAVRPASPKETYDFSIIDMEMNILLDQTKNEYNNPIIIYPDTKVMTKNRNDHKFKFRLREISLDKSVSYNVIYSYDQASLQNDSNLDALAYWAPKGYYVDIPIQPKDGDPKYVFTNPLSGCALAVDHFGTFYRVHHVNGGTIDKDYNNRIKQETVEEFGNRNEVVNHGYGLEYALEYKDYAGYPNPKPDPDKPPMIDAENAVAFMAYLDKEKKWEIHYQTQEGSSTPCVDNRHINVRGKEWKALLPVIATKVQKRNKIQLNNELFREYSITDYKIPGKPTIIPADNGNSDDMNASGDLGLPSTSVAGGEESSTSTSNDETTQRESTPSVNSKNESIQTVDLKSCAQNRRRKGCLFNKGDVKHFVEFHGEKFNINAKNLFKFLKTSKNEGKNSQVLKFIKSHGIIDHVYRPAIESLYENRGYKRAQMKKHIDEKVNSKSKSQKSGSKSALIERTTLLHGIYSTGQSCSNQLNSSSCLLGVGGITWGFIPNLATKFPVKRLRNLFLNIKGKLETTKSLRAAGAAVGAVFDVIDMGFQVHTLVDCYRRPKENSCSNKEIRDSFVSLAIDGVSIISTIIVAAYFTPGVGLAIGTAIFAIQQIYAGISAVQEFRENYGTTVGEDVSIFFRTILMIEMSNDIEELKVRSSFVNNSAEQMCKILEDNNIAIYAAGLGYMLKENQFIANGAKINLKDLRNETFKVSRFIPKTKENIEMICLPAPVVGQNNTLRNFEVLAELKNMTIDEKYYCDNAMVFKNKSRNGDFIVFNLELINAGEIIGSDNKINIFNIYDNKNPNLFKSIKKRSLISGSIAFLGNVVKMNPIYKVVNGIIEGRSIGEIAKEVVPFFDTGDGVVEGIKNDKPVLEIVEKAVSSSIANIIPIGTIFHETFDIDLINLPNNTYSNLTIFGGSSVMNQFIFAKYPFTAKIIGGANATNIIDCSAKGKSNQVFFFHLFTELKIFFSVTFFIKG